MAPADRLTVAAAGRTLTLSNLGKMLWPADGITKAELVDYYTRIAPVMLPHFHDRPVVLTRYPDGIDGKWFYHKDAPPNTPDWIRRWRSRTEDGRVLDFLLLDEPAALTYVANLGAVELHPWLSRSPTPDRPDWAVIDLDPAEGTTFEDVLAIARLVRQLLTAVGVCGFPKLSGATGVHIYCPCTSDHTYRETAAFAEMVGQLLLRLRPDIVTLERAVAKRTGKVYIDYLQNRRGQTITAVYGVRPRTGAPVSAPVTWEEVEGFPPRFTIRSIWQRLDAVGDLFAPVLSSGQDLRTATAALQSIL